MNDKNPKYITDLYRMPDGKNPTVIKLDSPMGAVYDLSDTAPTETVPVRVVPLYHAATILSNEYVASAAVDVVQLTLDGMCHEATNRGLVPMAYRVDDIPLDGQLIVNLWAGDER